MFHFKNIGFHIKGQRSNDIPQKKKAYIYLQTSIHHNLSLLTHFNHSPTRIALMDLKIIHYS